MIKMIKLFYELMKDVNALFVVLGVFLLVLAVPYEIKTKFFSIRIARLGRVLLSIVGCCLLVLVFLPLVARSVSHQKSVRRIELKSPVLAVFRDKYPRNEYKSEWQIFNDNKWFGKSEIWYETVPRETPGDYFLRVHFKTDGMLEEPYCGIYTDFSYPPHGVLDMSDFSAIEFEARYHPESTNQAPTFLLQVAVLGIPQCEYHEATFALPKATPEFQTVRILFSSLRTPSWVEKQHPLQLCEIFRIAFTVKGKDVSGSLDIDSIRLVE